MTVRKRWEPGTVVRIKATRLVVHVDDVEAVGEDPLGSLVKGEEPSYLQSRNGRAWVQGKGIGS